MDKNIIPNRNLLQERILSNQCKITDFTKNEESPRLIQYSFVVVDKWLGVVFKQRSITALLFNSHNNTTRVGSQRPIRYDSVLLSVQIRSLVPSSTAVAVSWHLQLAQESVTNGCSSGASSAGESLFIFIDLVAGLYLITVQRRNVKGCEFVVLKVIVRIQ